MTRGVGGARIAPAAAEAHLQFNAQSFIMPVASKAWTAEGSFLVVERWFRHVEPE